jgi:MFS family permease
VCFSVGFLIGPMVGAYFASYARTVVATQHYYFTSPALFAIGVTVIELVLIVTMLPETLPEHMRVCADGYVYSKFSCRNNALWMYSEKPWTM